MSSWYSHQQQQGNRKNTSRNKPYIHKQVANTLLSRPDRELWDPNSHPKPQLGCPNTATHQCKAPCTQKVMNCITKTDSANRSEPGKKFTHHTASHDQMMKKSIIDLSSA